MGQGGQTSCDVVGGKVRPSGAETIRNTPAGLSTAALSVEGETQTAQEMEKQQEHKVAAATTTPTTNKDEGQLAQASDEDARTQTDDERGHALTGSHVDEDDDEQTQSDPECGRRCRRRRPSPTPSSGADSGANDHVVGNAPSKDNSSIACGKSSGSTTTGTAVAGGHSTRAAAAAPPHPKETKRWRCGCGCVVKAGRRACSMCGGTAVAAATAAAATLTESSSLHGGRESPPLDRHVGSAHERSSPSCPPITETLSVSSSPPLSCEGLQYSRDRVAVGGGSEESPVVCTTNSSTSSSESSNSNSQPRRRRPSQPTASKRTSGRWQCGCGCSMKAGGKRCVMCGQPRPSGCTDATVARPRSVDNDVEGGNSSGSCSGGGGDCSTGTTANGSAGGGSKAVAVGRGGGPLKSPSVGTATPARVSSSTGAGGSCTGRSPPAAAPGGDEGPWRCTGCGNEYSAARLKCRACKTPKPVVATGVFPVRGTSQIAVRNSNNRQVQYVGNDRGTESLARTDSYDLKTKCPSGVGNDDGTRDAAGELAPAPTPAVPSIRGDRLTQDCGGDEKNRPTAFRVRDLCAGVADEPASPAVGPKPRQPSLGTPTPTAGRRVALASLPRSIQQHTPELGVGAVQGMSVAIACAADADESPAAGSTSTLLDGADSSPWPATQDSQDDDSLAELFPSLHQFEAEQERCDGGESSGNASLEGAATTTTGRRRSKGGIGRFAGGGWSPLIPSPPSLPSSRPPNISIAAARSPLPTSTGALLLPPPPVLSYAPTSGASASQVRSSPSSDAAAAVDAAIYSAAITTTVATASSSAASVPAICTSQTASPTRTLGFSCSGDKPAAPSEDSGSRCTTAWDEPDETQDSKNDDDEWGQDAQGDTECEDIGSPACGSSPTPSHGDEKPDYANAEAEEAAACGIAEDASAEIPSGGRGGGGRETCEPGDGLESEEVTAGSRARNRPSNPEEKSSVRHTPREREGRSPTQGNGSKPGSSIGGGGGGGDGGGDGSSQSSIGGDSTRGGGRDRARSPGKDGEMDEDVCCDVCGSAASKEDDPIVLCDGEACTTAVHADCYGVAEVPEGPWLCEPCCSSSKQLSRGSDSSSSPTSTVAAAATTKGKQRCYPTSSGFPKKSASASAFCALCSRSGGALKLSQCGKWAHVVCVWWTPELTSDPDTVRPGPLSKLDPERGSLACSRCHERGGAAVKCAIPSCLEACHPFCALRAGLLLQENDGTFELFCRTHSRRERRNEGHAAGACGDVFPDGAPGATWEEEGHAREQDSTSSNRDTWVGEGGQKKESGRRSTQPPPPSPESIGLFGCSQSQVKPPVASAATAGRRQLLRKQAMLSDSDGDEEGSEHGCSSPAAGTTVGGRPTGGGMRTSDEKGTPLKIFDMAPPATSAAKLVRGGPGGRGECSESMTCDSPPGGDGGLMTLSQAVSPVEDVRKDAKRRRLKKVRGKNVVGVYLRRRNRKQ